MNKAHALTIGFLIAALAMPVLAASVTEGTDGTEGDDGPALLDHTTGKIFHSHQQAITTTYPAGTTSTHRGGDSVTIMSTDICGSSHTAGLPLCLDTATKIDVSVLPDSSIQGVGAATYIPAWSATNRLKSSYLSYIDTSWGDSAFVIDSPWQAKWNETFFRNTNYWDPTATIELWMNVGPAHSHLMKLGPNIVNYPVHWSLALQNGLVLQNGDVDSVVGLTFDYNGETSPWLCTRFGCATGLWKATRSIETNSGASWIDSAGRAAMANTLKVTGPYLALNGTTSVTTATATATQTLSTVGTTTSTTTSTACATGTITAVETGTATATSGTTTVTNTTTSTITQTVYTQTTVITVTRTNVTSSTGTGTAVKVLDGTDPTITINTGTATNQIVTGADPRLLPNPLAGSGTKNYLPKFTSTVTGTATATSSAVGNSSVFDDGTNITVDGKTLNVDVSLGGTYLAFSNAGTHQIYAAQNLAASTGDFLLYTNSNGTSGWILAEKIERATGIATFYKDLVGARKLTLGTAGGVSGSVDFNGATSGVFSIESPAVVTTYKLTPPAAAATAAGQVWASTGANATMQWATPTTLASNLTAGTVPRAASASTLEDSHITDSNTIGIGMSYPLRITGNLPQPSTGEGLEAGYEAASDYAYIQAYNRTAGTYGIMDITGSQTRLSAFGGGESSAFNLYPTYATIDVPLQGYLQSPSAQCPAGQYLTTNGSTELTMCSTPSGTGTGMTCSGTCSASNWVTFADSTHVTNASYTPVNPTRSISTSSGLQGGGNLEADRTISPVYGTTANTVAQGNDTRIVNAVQTSRTISTSGGLQGGGDLSANRTLSPVYGTTAGTVAEGNDARFSGRKTADRVSTPTGGASIALDSAWHDIASDTFTIDGTAVDVDAAAMFVITVDSQECLLGIFVGSTLQGVQGYVGGPKLGSSYSLKTATTHAYIGGLSGSVTITLKGYSLGTACSVSSGANTISMHVKSWK